MLPKREREILNGGVYLQRVRCGKSACRCATSDHRHTAHYFLYRQNGKLRKKHVPLGNLESFKRLVKSAREEKRRWRATRKEGIDIYRTLGRLLRFKDQLNEQ